MREFSLIIGVLPIASVTSVHILGDDWGEGVGDGKR